MLHALGKDVVGYCFAILFGVLKSSFTIKQLLLLRTVGIILPVYIVARVLTAIQQRRQQQVLTVFCFVF